ncbi:general secretion pathway protein GspB [Polaromonas jejuensis]|uniref:General secretion pathway protein GspB n=2 Tax=Polaromonas jejuensis TaxID=457502 RepID=A0ABW0QB46_9BURK
MSYILEALKKAEQARLATKLPDIKSITLSAEEPVREPSAWLYGATLVAVIAGATGLGWWWSGKPNENAMHEKPAAILPATGREVARAPLAKPFNRAMDLSVMDGEAHNGNAKSSPSAVSSGASLVAPPANARPAAPAQMDAGSRLRGVSGKADKVVGKDGSLEQNNAASASAPASPAPDKKAAAGRTSKPAAAVPGEAPVLKPLLSARVLRLDELPPEVRREIPKISTSGYVDSAEAGGRVVSINERSLREGDELIAGMKLEQIAQDHLLFSFRGYRFRVEMF